MSSTSSKTDPAADLLVGIVRKPHGVRGEVAVEVLSDVGDRLHPGRTVRAGAFGKLTIIRSRPHRGGLLVTFWNREERDSVEELRGVELTVPASEARPAPDGSYWYYELIGCRCTDKLAGDLGEVTDIVEDGGGMLLAIESEGRRLLVPFVRSFLDRVDTVAGVIETELPAGLIETCTSKS